MIGNFENSPVGFPTATTTIHNGKRASESSFTSRLTHNRLFRRQDLDTFIVVTDAVNSGSLCCILQTTVTASRFKRLT